MIKVDFGKIGGRGKTFLYQSERGTSLVKCSVFQTYSRYRHLLLLWSQTSAKWMSVRVLAIQFALYALN